MARPRIFISSTHYDLKHLRLSLDAFVDSLGFEPILSEKGDIAYSPDAPLDESCYREAAGADILVLIIGGRYGAEVSSSELKRDTQHTFLDRYESITRKEFRAAIERNVPTYILVDSLVYAEYRIFQKNRSNREITYGEVDSVNIFHLLDEILSHRRNNPVYSFERASDIEGWLRDQWSGLFKEFLSKRSQHQQLVTLAQKVEELGEVNGTLRRYIEAIITKLSPDDSAGLIKEEHKRLEAVRIEHELEAILLINYLKVTYGLSMDDLVDVIRKADSVRWFVSMLKDRVQDQGGAHARLDELAEQDHLAVLRDINEARALMGLSLIVR